MWFICSVVSVCLQHSNLSLLLRGAATISSALCLGIRWFVLPFLFSALASRQPHEVIIWLWESLNFWHRIQQSCWVSKPIVRRRCHQPAVSVLHSTAATVHLYYSYDTIKVMFEPCNPSALMMLTESMVVWGGTVVVACGMCFSVAGAGLLWYDHLGCIRDHSVRVHIYSKCRSEQTKSERREQRAHCHHFSSRGWTQLNCIVVSLFTYYTHLRK